jgi:Lar family restriction alleviation protein
MSSEELKPCPFCGGEAEMRLYDCEYFAQCIECFNSTAADHQTKEAAASAWNRRAQLAAIQGGMGEAVEVVAVRFSSDGFGSYIADTAMGVPAGYPGDVREPLMTVAQHQRITAAMAAEVERLSRMLNNATNDGIKLADERDALAAENEALVRNLRGKHSLVGATYEHLIRQRDEALAKLAELAAIEGQEPVLWFRSLIGAQCKPDGRCYDVVFSPCEGFMPLYALPPASPDVEGLVNELQRIAEKCSDPDATDALDTALSTWRQAQEGKP